MLKKNHRALFRHFWLCLTLLEENIVSKINKLETKKKITTSFYPTVKFLPHQYFLIKLLIYTVVECYNLKKKIILRYNNEIDFDTSSFVCYFLDENIVSKIS